MSKWPIWNFIKKIIRFAKTGNKVLHEETFWTTLMHTQMAKTRKRDYSLNSITETPVLRCCSLFWEAQLPKCNSNITEPLCSSCTRDMALWSFFGLLITRLIKKIRNVIITLIFFHFVIFTSVKHKIDVSPVLVGQKYPSVN